MPILTIELLDENPWNVLTHELPERPSRLLLLNAQIAATCLRHMTDEKLEVACAIEEDQSYPPEIDEGIKQWSRAHGKIGEIISLLEYMYEEPCRDFWLSRRINEPSLFEELKEAVRRIFMW